MPATVETVRGPVELDRLGPTLMHEHVFVIDPEAMQNFGHFWGAPYWDEEERVADAIAKLRRLRDGGIETIVDPPSRAGAVHPAPPADQRRGRPQHRRRHRRLRVPRAADVPREPQRRVARRAVRPRDPRGIDDTGVKAAFLKCAVEKDGLIGDVPRVLAAIAAAAVETGAPVMVHTNAPARTGLLALETLTSAGVDPRRIVIAHAGDSNDLDYLRAIADTGASLGCDRFNIEHFNPDANRIETLVALVAEGYSGPRASRSRRGVLLRLWSATRGSPTSIPTTCTSRRTIVPALLAAGVTQAQIDEMLVENPRRFFG